MHNKLTFYACLLVVLKLFRTNKTRTNLAKTENLDKINLATKVSGLIISFAVFYSFCGADREKIKPDRWN